MERNSSFLNREFKKALFPVMLSVLGGSVNTLIDSAFVSRRLDSDALAAVSLNMPIFLILCMFGCLFGMGSFVASSRALGEKKEGKAAEYFHAAMQFSTVVGMAFVLAGVFFSEEVADLICHDEGLINMVSDYCRITLMGALPYILIYIPTYYLQLAGRSKDITITMLIMVVSDIALDWLMLYVMNDGVAGAATASVVSTLFASTYGFFMLQRYSGIFRIKVQRFRLFGLKDIVLFGSTSAMGSLFDVVKMLVLNYIIYKAGGTTALAVWTVVNSLLEISLCITSSIPRTAAPMLGIYIGGHDNEGVRNLMRLQMKLGLIMTVFYGVIICLFHKPIGWFFKLEESVLIPFACMGSSVILEVFCSILGSYYNVAKRVAFSNFIMFVRSFAFSLLFAHVLLIRNHLIWLFLPQGMTAALLITLLTARLISGRERKKGKDLSGILLLDNAQESKVKCFSIVSSNEGICKASEDIIEFCMENGMDRKKGMRLGLAMEEVMTVMVQKSLEKKDDPVDVRIYTDPGGIGVEIMCSGREYNLFRDAIENDDEFNMGVRMIEKLSKDCHYIYTLGMNILSVEFANE